MANLSKEEKRAIMKKWKASQEKKYILSKAQVRKYFAFLENALNQQPCDHTLRHTEKWLAENVKGEKTDGIIEEIKEMGGYCDCEALMNCYERYDIC